MRIVFVVPRFYPCQGGYENYTLGLARGLRSAGHSVRVVTTNALELEYFWLREFRHMPPGQEIYDNIEILRLPISHNRWLRHASRLLAFLPSADLKARFATPSFEVEGIRQALAESTADVIHVGPLPYNRMMYEGIREGGRRGIPVVVTPCTHFGEEKNSDVSRYYTQPFQIELLSRCDSIFALTAAEQEGLARLGVPKDKLVVTGAGIDISEVTGGSAEEFIQQYKIDGPVVLHLGMKAPDKGSIAIVEAMKQLWRAGSPAWLVMAGPSLSSFDDYLKDQIGSLSRSLNLGVVRDERKKVLLAAATVLVQTSRVESLGLVYLEAWANAKPVIAADIAVTRELIADGSDGLLVPFGDIGRLADAIQSVIEDPAKAKEMGLAGQQKVKRQFSNKAVIQNILPHFEGGSLHGKEPVQG